MHRIEGKRRGIGLVRLAGWVVVAGLVMGFNTCPSKKDFIWQPDLSVNLAVPGTKWPKLDKLPPAQIEVYEKYGAPDFFRVWFNPHGELATEWEATRLYRTKNLEKYVGSWIYTGRKIEVVFRSPAKYEEVPLSDKLSLICRRGDPESRDVQNKKGMVREVWTYYSYGERYIFLDDRLADTELFRGFGAPLDRR
jgi:hypothetical protein